MEPVLHGKGQRHARWFGLGFAIPPPVTWIECQVSQAGEWQPAYVPIMDLRLANVTGASFFMMGTNREPRPWQRLEIWLLATPLLVLLLAFGSARLPLNSLFKVRMVPPVPPVRPLGWSCDHKTRQRDLMLDFGRFAIVFKGIIQPPTGNAKWVVVGQEGWQGNTYSYSSSGVGAGHVVYPVHVTSRGGINQITVGRYSFRILDAGPTLVFGSQTFDVSGSPKVFVVDPQGAIHVQP